MFITLSSFGLQAELSNPGAASSEVWDSAVKILGFHKWQTLVILDSQSHRLIALTFECQNLSPWRPLLKFQASRVSTIWVTWWLSGTLLNSWGLQLVCCLGSSQPFAFWSLGSSPPLIASPLQQGQLSSVSKFDSASTAAFSEFLLRAIRWDSSVGEMPGPRGCEDPLPFCVSAQSLPSVIRWQVRTVKPTPADFTWKLLLCIRVARRWPWFIPLYTFSRCFRCQSYSSRTKPDGYSKI